MLADHIGLWHEEVVAVGRAVPGEELTGRLLRVLAGERDPHSVRDWLLFLADTAAEDVAGRLEHAGYLRRVAGRWRGRRWVPVDADSAFAPLLRVRAALDCSRPLTVDGGVLAGLVTARSPSRPRRVGPPRLSGSIQPVL